MGFITGIFSSISGLGKYVMVPLMVAIIGIAFKCNVNKAIKGGMTVGIGLFGLDLALSLVGSYLGPVAMALVEKANLSLDAIDVGWTALSGIAFATEIGAVIIPFMLLVNIVLLAIGATKTMDIDIWNFWHFALTGSLMYVLTGNILVGLVAATTHAVVTFSFADRTAEDVQKVIGIPGISIPHGGALGCWVFGYGMEKVYNFFGKFFYGKKLDNETLDKEKVKKFSDNPIFKVIQDPVYVGFILGVVISLIGGFDLKTCLTTGMAMAALLFLTPRMVKILMEGLVPISQACSKIMNKKYKGQKLYIGMDTAVGLGTTTAMIGAVVMIPVMVVLSMIIPGNRVIPMASLAACGYNCGTIQVGHKGKVMRTLLSTTLMFIALFLLATYMTPIITDVALANGYATDYAVITALSATLFGAAPIFFLYTMGTTVGLIACLVIIVGCIVLNRRYFKKMKENELNTVNFEGTDKAQYIKE